MNISAGRRRPRTSPSPDSFLPRGGHQRFFLDLPAGDHLVDYTVGLRFLSRHDEVPIRILRNLLQRLSRGGREDLVEKRAIPQDLLRLDLDVHCLPLSSTVWLVDQDARMWQSVPLPLRAARKEDRRRARRLTHAGRGDIRLDVLHGVVDGEQGGDRASWRVDVEV